MPEGILKFKLPEEQSEFKWASEACGTLADIHDFAQALRELMDAGKQTCWKEVWDLFNEHLGEHIE